MKQKRYTPKAVITPPRECETPRCQGERQLYRRLCAACEEATPSDPAAAGRMLGGALHDARPR